jgi:N-acetyl-gamma-glutamylphosphate reductase
MKTIAIAGASGGIGAALLDCLVEHDDVEEIHATYHRSTAGSSMGNVAGEGSTHAFTGRRWTQPMRPL